MGIFQKVPKGDKVLLRSEDKFEERVRICNVTLGCLLDIRYYLTYYLFTFVPFSFQAELEHDTEVKNAFNLRVCIKHCIKHKFELQVELHSVIFACSCIYV